MSICVIGAGILGLPTAAYIQEKEPRCKVTLIANKFSPDVTSDIAAGFWRPIYLSDPNTERLKSWSVNSFDFIRQLYREDSVKYGAGLMSGYELSMEPQNVNDEEPFWSDIVIGYKKPKRDELDSFGWGNYKSSCFYTTLYLSCSQYLPTVMEKFKNSGGVVEQKKLNNIAEISDQFDVVVNCSGLGSFHLVNDQKCFPIRGQIYRVKAPFIKHFVITDDFYILLNHDRVILGGTHQQNNWSTSVDPNDSRRIWNGCTEVIPSLKSCTVIDEIVGLRPGRNEIRLERENMLINNKQKPIVHCYGHGGSGVTLFHGCAQETASLAVDALHQKTSKL